MQAVEGDLSLPSCGISEQTLEKICGEITHIIHCAGCVSFEAPILEAVGANITTALNVCNLAKDCPNLQRLTTTSTAYVQPHINGGIYEKLVDLPCPVGELLEDILEQRSTEAEILQLTAHQNTYTLTKCMAEHLLLERRGSIPITIVRPSIISASRAYPEPGWIDSKAAFAGFVTAFGAGILHVVDGNPNARGDIVPVDDVSRRLIDETLFSTAAPEKPKIVYAVAGLENCLQWSTGLRTLVDFFEGKPPGPGGKASLSYFGPRNLRFRFHEMIQQRLRFSLAELWYELRGDEKMRTRMVKVSNLVIMLNRIFPYFIHNTFDFRGDSDLLGDGFDSEKYVGLVCKGVEKHLLRRMQ